MRESERRAEEVGGSLVVELEDDLESNGMRL